MIAQVVWNNRLDRNDYKGIADEINALEGYGTTCAEHVEELVDDQIETPDEEMTLLMNNININY